MKILKIELQNINSLKSDTPIVIDFENSQFKDIGLYAITGSTGAGKTTILDAITIALYHSVPRFNTAREKSLINVVSHGASNAFCRVTFENDNQVFEAYWGARLATNTGKVLQNPTEEVSLKNLSKETILATQKRKFVDAIESVTQLSYTQFLRSVMLAQGEFASFLSAKGPEKGKLLEQITGEDIYKKIGFGILDRKSKEENSLKELESTINSDDVLSVEEKEQKIIEKSQNDELIKQTKLNINSSQIVIDWYEKWKELTTQSDNLNQKEKEITTLLETHKEELKQLELNQKAEPFKELLHNLRRNKNNQTTKNNQKLDFKTELDALKPIIENLKFSEKSISEKLIIASENIKIWQPKFDNISTLETNIKNQIEQNNNTSNLEKETAKIIGTLQLKNENFTQLIKDSKTDLETIEAYLFDHKKIAEVDKQISIWTTDLTDYKNYSNTLKINTDFIKLKEIEITAKQTEIAKQSIIVNKESENIKGLEQALKTITKSLEKNEFTALLSEKDKLVLEESKLKRFQEFTLDFNKLEVESTQYKQDAKQFFADSKIYSDKIEINAQKINSQQKSVDDAQKILDLENSIKSYEQDRLKLIEGEACQLCGATEHPFVSNQKVIDIPKTKTDLAERVLELNKLNDLRNELSIEYGKIGGKIERINKHLSLNETNINTLKGKAFTLNLDLDLTNASKTNIQLNLVQEKLKELKINIDKIQVLIIQKDKAVKDVNTQKDSLGTQITGLATQKTSLNHLQTEKTDKYKSNQKIKLLHSDLEKDLKSRLTNFGYDLPTAENTTEFINNIEKSILVFNSKSAKLVNLTNKKLNSELELKNNTDTLKTKRQEQTNYKKKIGDILIIIDEFKNQRLKILPANISIKEKRTELEKANNSLTKQIDDIVKQLNLKVNEQSVKNGLFTQVNADLKLLESELVNLNKAINSKISDSIFESIQSIENSLLTIENKDKFTKNKDLIQKSKIEFDLGKKQNIAQFEVLNQTKTFKITKQEAEVNHAELLALKETQLIILGEINETFRKDEEIKSRNKEIFVKIKAQSEICKVWKQLFYVIGNSKDAFNIYVQRLTLKHLLDLANIHLYKLNKRYSLKMEDTYKPKEELNFNLIDHYQTDQVRMVDTSSGGEKFIISLALALGLSDLASKNVKIDSLFIDEGFGTLDNNTLETVISTLETLQSQGKKIGIISHVENLKERIPTQIQVTKKSNGVSTVSII